MSERDRFANARSFGLRLIVYRPRSEAEVKERISRRFDSALAHQVVESLRQAALLDDSKFARRWAESRLDHNPRSASAIRREIAARGVEASVAADAVRDVDDEESAYRAASKHAGRLSKVDLPTFRRRLWAYLSRRGYPSSVARSTIDRIWNETRG